MCVDLQTSGSEEEVETESDCLPSFSRPQPDVWDSEGKVVIKDPLDNAVTLDHKKNPIQFSLIHICLGLLVDKACEKIDIYEMAITVTYRRQILLFHDYSIFTVFLFYAKGGILYSSEDDAC